MKRKQPALFAVLFFSLFVVSLFAQEWKYVGVVTSDASRGESAIVVKTDVAIVAGRAILIESRDGLVRGTYEVRHVYGQTVVLEKSLRETYVSGSRVYQ